MIAMYFGVSVHAESGSVDGLCLVIFQPCWRGSKHAAPWAECPVGQMIDIHEMFLPTRRRGLEILIFDDHFPPDDHDGYV